MASDDEVIIELDCKHVERDTLRSLSDKGFSEHYCSRCQRLRKITGWASSRAGYWFKCATCGYTRYFGTGEMSRNLQAVGHASRRKHRVRTGFGTTETKAYDYEPHLTALPFDAPPF